MHVFWWLLTPKMLTSLQVGVAMSLVLVALAQNYYNAPPMPQEERYADSAPDSMIPSVPWPEWLPSDLSSIPGNIPHSNQWQPPPKGSRNNNAPQGILEIPTTTYN